LGQLRIWSDEPVARSELLGFVDCYVELGRSDLRTLDDICRQPRKYDSSTGSLAYGDKASQVLIIAQSKLEGSKYTL
jgi:hypothetical protein